MSLQRESQYYSGQGTLLLGSKDPVTGEVVGGLRAVGNVSALDLGIAVQEFEHKESESGSRGVDLTLTTETNVNFNFTMESLDRENLALVLNGTDAEIASGSASDTSAVGAHDLWTMLPHVQISNVIVTDDPNTAPYAEGTDYVVDERSGMIMALSTGGITDGESLLVNYDYAAAESIEGFTSATNPIRWARFAGLNTAKGDKPVIVDIYRVSVTPLQSFALINDEIAQMAITAKALSDSTRTAGSKFFSVTLGA